MRRPFPKPQPGEIALVPKPRAGVLLPRPLAGAYDYKLETELPRGTQTGLNDFKNTRYGGPCPPIGRHRYFHKLYALDTVLPDLRHPTKAQLEQAMQGHVKAQAELIGMYQRGH